MAVGVLQLTVFVFVVMQSGGGTHQGWNAGPRSPLASPSSSVSAPSGPHLGFDSIQQQKQQRQLLQDQVRVDTKCGAITSFFLVELTNGFWNLSCFLWWVGASLV